MKILLEMLQTDLQNYKRMSEKGFIYNFFATPGFYFIVYLRIVNFFESFTGITKTILFPFRILLKLKLKSLKIKYGIGIRYEIQSCRSERYT